jgi:ankyrin repeat protein
MSKSSSSSHKKTTSLESVSSELNVLDLANELYHFIVTGYNKGAISILRHDPLLANHVYDDENFPDLRNNGLERATPLSIACISGNYEVVKELFKRQYYIDVNFKSYGNLTPLNLVDPDIMNKGDKGYLIVKKLLNNGADINNIDSEGFTLFRFVCEYFNSDMIEYLLKKPNLDINKKLRDNDGPIQTLVLQYCMREYNPDILNMIEKILKRKDLKINTTGWRGNNVLNILANEDRKQEPGYSDEKIKRLALLLIENGADPNIKNNRGKPALVNKLIQHVYFEYILSKVKKLQANQRLEFAKMMIDEKHESTPNDIIIKILKSLKMPPLNKETLDNTNNLLFKQQLQEELEKEIKKEMEKKLREELSKEMYKEVRSQFRGEKIDDMIEFYRKLLRNPNLTQAQRRAYKRQKRTRKRKLSITTGSSDMDTSELELKRAIKMSIDEFNKASSGSKKNKKKKKKTKIKK